MEHNKLGVQPKVIDAKTHSTDQVVEPVVRQKFAKIRDHYNELRLKMDGGYSVVFRAYNEGVAYRFETSLPQEKVKVYGEESAFNFPTNYVVYYPQEDSFYSHNERKYLPQHLSEIAPEFIATLPAIVDVGQGAKLAIAESDLEDYPGLWLRGTGGNWSGCDLSAVSDERSANQRSRLQASRNRRLHRRDVRKEDVSLARDRDC